MVFDPRHDSRLAAALGARWAACLRSLDGGRAAELVELGREYGQRVAASGQLDGWVARAGGALRASPCG